MQDTGTSFRAQNGEDRWLDTYFQGKREGYFVEVGAYDGVDLSNTYHFEQIGWHGVLVEPDPDNADRAASELIAPRFSDIGALLDKVDAVDIVATTSGTARPCRQARCSCAMFCSSASARDWRVRSVV